MALVALACGSDDDQPEPTSTPVPPSTPPATLTLDDFFGDCESQLGLSGGQYPPERAFDIVAYQLGEMPDEGTKLVTTESDAGGGLEATVDVPAAVACDGEGDLVIAAFLVGDDVKPGGELGRTVFHYYPVDESHP